MPRDGDRSPNIDDRRDGEDAPLPPNKLRDGEASPLPPNKLRDGEASPSPSGCCCLLLRSALSIFRGYKGQGQVPEILARIQNKLVELAIIESKPATAGQV